VKLGASKGKEREREKASYSEGMENTYHQVANHRPCVFMFWGVVMLLGFFFFFFFFFFFVGGVFGGIYFFGVLLFFL